MTLNDNFNNSDKPQPRYYGVPFTHIESQCTSFDISVKLIYCSTTRYLFERVARKFVDEMLSAESGQILRLTDAHAVFRSLLKQRELPDIKRSDFKAVVGPLIREQFNVALSDRVHFSGPVHELVLGHG